jgi:hypothetical protein
MSDVHAPPPNPDAAKGLPPVVPPSGRHIAQLFLVPGLIVGGAIAILLGFSWLAGGSRTPQQFLKNIDSTNADIRWRAASDLAQVLKRDEKLASDPAFALRLAEHLQKALDELDRLEREKVKVEIGSDSSKADTAKAKTTLAAQRNYVQYLGACLGNLSIPIGVSLLTDLARNGRGSDPVLRALTRRQAVWALATLGDGLKRFDKLTDERKAEIRRVLESESESAAGDAKTWAATALAWMDGKGSLGVIQALADCAKEDKDVFLREQTALALNFWEGDAAEKTLADDTLFRLARDTGRGERIDVPEGE